MARPSKFSEEVVEKLLRAVQAGNFVEVAAVYAGISASTFYEWMRRGRAGEPPFAAFVEDVEQAQATAEVGKVVQLSEAGKRDWRAAVQWLRLARRERWADRLPEIPPGQIEVTVRWPEDEGRIAKGLYPSHEGSESPEGES